MARPGCGGVRTALAAINANGVGKTCLRRGKKGINTDYETDLVWNGLLCA